MRKLGSTVQDVKGARVNMEGVRDEFEFTTPKKWGDGQGKKVNGKYMRNPAAVVEDGKVEDLGIGVKGMDIGTAEAPINVDSISSKLGGFTIGASDSQPGVSQNPRQRRKSSKSKKTTTSNNTKKSEPGKGVFVFGVSPQKVEKDSTVLPPSPPTVTSTGQTATQQTVGGVGLGLGFIPPPPPPPTATSSNQNASGLPTHKDKGVGDEDMEDAEEMEVTVEDMENVMRDGAMDGTTSSSKPPPASPVPQLQPLVGFSSSVDSPGVDLAGKFSSFNIGVSEKSPEDKIKKDRRDRKGKSRTGNNGNTGGVNPYSREMEGGLGGSLADRFKRQQTEQGDDMEEDRCGDNKDSRSEEKKEDSRAPQHTAPTGEQPQPTPPETANTNNTSNLQSMRRKAGSLYTSGMYSAAVAAYTSCISLHSVSGRDETKAVLLGNRAASFMMMEAYAHSARDCEDAIGCLPQGSMLGNKIYTRAGRAWLKEGEIQKSEMCWSKVGGEEGSKGMVECKGVRDAIDRKDWGEVMRKCPGWIAGAERAVHYWRGKGEWDRVSSVSEKLARKIANGETQAEWWNGKRNCWSLVTWMTGRGKVLLGKGGIKGKEGGKEVTVRLKNVWDITSVDVYAEALWRMEAFHESTGVYEEAGETVKIKERDSILAAKDAGDVFFRKAAYTSAVASYSQGIKIYPEPKLGGKLLATLYCNRAAGWMGCRKYREGAKDSTEALRLDSDYAKARLRRARCYGRCKLWKEAKQDYLAWTDLAAKQGARPEEIKSVKKEIQELETSEAEEKKEKKREEWFQKNFRREENKKGASNEDAGADRGGPYRGPHPGTSGASGSRRGSDGGYNHGSGYGGSGYGGSGYDYGYGAGGRRRHSSYGEGGAAPPRKSPGSDDRVTHYAVLGVDKKAQGKDIKKAYHQMARKYHPDKNKEEGASDKFRRIQLAWETLGNETGKRRYDAELVVGMRRGW